MSLISSSSRLHFRLDAQATGSRARAATFRTLHNKVQTPVFMPVGTNATVKAQRTQTLEDAGSQMLLANTYHLLLRPGAEVFRKLGGIHKFMSWERSVLTDSGGFQIFSLPHSRLMSEAGAVFQSYLDGRTILLSPELSIETQVAIGSDIMMALDQCVASTADEGTVRAAMEVTHRWAAPSLAARGDSPQSMFSIVQGALLPELRRESAARLVEMPFDGYAIGGLAVGETKNEREEVCELTAELLPADKPRYLMGVGTPLDILEAVHRGLDMFDCIIPTQVAQRGGVFTSRGYLQMRRGVYKASAEKLDPECPCPTCARYSRAYLHHLTKSAETLGWQLLGQHNIYFYHQLMREIRASILADRFAELYRDKRAFLHEPDLDNPITQSKPKKKRPTQLGDYEVHIAREGFGSIRQISSGEIMHMRTPPMDEARQLYIEQSRLSERLREDDAEPLVIWDVRLGAAANAMAAIHCYEREATAGPVRPMRIISFENDLDSLKLALIHNNLFPYLRHAGPPAIVEHGDWRSKRHAGLEWLLVRGDFPATIEDAPSPPDLIFYDMFSSKTSADAWTLDTFRRLFAACEGRAVEIFTYTCSTSVRVALLAAGFYVAQGRRMGAKEETTMAFTPVAYQARWRDRNELLASAWLERWNRSGAKFPGELPHDERAAFEQSIRAHEQFSAR
ncbi:MAG TPA: tRNA guanosine(34) transglycosylase Tgt [Chthoniobacterales bacterium]|nr:tRNA guanosine(34) transglycosylase Tgt [Chthoniobacterales bacterium]